MKRIALLLPVLLATSLIWILATHVAYAGPKVIKRHNVDTSIEYPVTFPITETGVDSPAMKVNGLCSVVFESAGSDDASLYAVPTSETATGSGTLIVAYTDSSTVPTVFQPGTRWVRAVAVSAVTGGSIMRVTCSNAQLASTGEACGTSGLAPYVGTGGRYKCEPEYSYDEDNNQLSVGEVAVDAAAGKNVIAMEPNSEFTGAAPSATRALLYWLTGTPEPTLVVETEDTVDTPTRVVTAHPDYTDETLEFGVAFTDIDNEYAVIAAGTTVVQNFCMVKAPHVAKEEIYTTSIEAETITIPLTGATGCSKAVTSTKPQQVYVVLGNPFIKDVWCTSNTNLQTQWIDGDGADIEFGISNATDVTPVEYLTAAHTLTYSHAALVAEYGGGFGRQSILRAEVDDFAADLFSGTVSGGGLRMVMLSATIVSVTRQTASAWTTLRLQCGLTFESRDTR